MSRKSRWLNAKCVHHLQCGKAGAANPGLCPLCGTKGVLVGNTFFVRKTWNREHDFVKVFSTKIHVGRGVPWSNSAVERHGEVRTHVHVLAALAGEHERCVAFSLCKADHGSVGRFKTSGWVFLKHASGALQLLGQVRFVGGHKCQSNRSRSVKALLRIPCNPLDARQRFGARAELKS